MKTMGNNKGGFSSIIGGWASYSNAVRIDTKAEKVEIQINKQIQKDLDATTKTMGTTKTMQPTKSTTDIEMRKAQTELEPVKE